MFLKKVFPTPVGVFLPWASTCAGTCGLPHARGGVSMLFPAAQPKLSSSPRPWGCFYQGSRPAQRVGVFPTPVGVFLFPSLPSYTWAGLPHARGGVSIRDPVLLNEWESSPRPWGCFYRRSSYMGSLFVFPTPVGVFLPLSPFWAQTSRLPHARGGVSFSHWARLWASTSSPRPWGCFHARRYLSAGLRVFPTPVGVFPPFPCGQCLPCRLPHARGGVSDFGSESDFDDESSPRPWGCFRGLADSAGNTVVFPTPVGVFLFPGRARQQGQGLPHARGGVSNLFQNNPVSGKVFSMLGGCSFGV